MNLQWNIETFILVTGITVSTTAIIYILRSNWRQYGLLFVLSAFVGELLCYFFIKMDFYSYPYRLFPNLSQMPVFLILTMFPCLVLLGVRYSPSNWAYKIPFYWVIVHIGVFLEVIAFNFTKVIKYEKYWDTWDSYTWWWLFLLVFEVVGGVIVSKEYRKPILEEKFRYLSLGWFFIHFVLISTIFLAGFYLGTKV